MKKRYWMSAILIIIVAFSFTACGNKPSDPPTEETPPRETLDTGNKGQTPNDTAEHTLIAYFSRVGNTDFPEGVDAITSASLNISDGELKGNTQLIAEYIQRQTGGELFLITTTEKYASDYDEVVNDVQQQHHQEIYPDLASAVEEMEKYDTVFLGFPNWDFDMPLAVYSFLEEYDFSGKTIVPFCTHGGSRFSDSIQTLQDMLPDSTVLEGLAISGDRAAEAQSEVEEWLLEMAFIKK